MRWKKERIRRRRKEQNKERIRNLDRGLLWPSADAYHTLDEVHREILSLSLSLSLSHIRKIFETTKLTVLYVDTRTVVLAQERELPSYFIRNQPFELKVEKWVLVHYILFSIKVLILALSREKPDLRCRRWLFPSAQRYSKNIFYARGRQTQTSSIEYPMRRVTRCRTCLGVPSERAPFVSNRGALWSNSFSEDGGTERASLLRATCRRYG